jgi:hypothetical protein
VAIERAGPGADGGYYTMRARDMKHLVAPLEVLMAPAAARAGGLPRETIGIGDGGNEVGMGKVLEKILTSSVPHSDKVPQLPVPKSRRAAFFVLLLSFFSMHPERDPSGPIFQRN